ncbi:hypothetical protein Q3G72_034779 [Acer saccharum]|nr:hypothetical protein Q3G72_034779 [Acer saccharum]
MEEGCVQKSVRWLQGLTLGTIGHELEALTHAGLQIVEAREGFIRCNFIVPSHLADEDGNWHVGAMATLIDSVGGAATHSFSGHVKTSVDFNISFCSTAEIQEEVEIEAKVVGNRGKLTSVQIEVRRRGNGEVIALGNEWMVSTNISSSQKMSKL